MINIQKNPNEPLLLRRHRTSNPGATYDNGPADMKSEIQQAVVNEQFGLCCYCMQRISPETVRVEHVLSQKKHPTQTLDYSNMAGACSCSKGLPKEQQYCDIYKGEMDFTFNLSCIQDKIQYEPQGKIKSSNSHLDDQLNNVLNLNVKYLVEQRRAVREIVTHFLSLEKTRGEIQSKIKQLSSPRNGMKDIFCGVMIFFLQKRLARI